MTQTNLSDGSSVIYVRVPNSDKEMLRSLADRDFEGSMSKCIRYLLRNYSSARLQTRRSRGRKNEQT